MKIYASSSLLSLASLSLELLQHAHPACPYTLPFQVLAYYLRLETLTLKKLHATSIPSSPN